MGWSEGRRPLGAALYSPDVPSELSPGASTGGEWTQLASKLGSGEDNYTLKVEEFIQFLFTKSETIDSCRFETKMRQNAPNPISIFFRVTPRTPATGGYAPRPPGRGGREGKGKEGKG